MYICELLPLKTTKKIETLTYFTSLLVEVGDLVEINMHGQILKAIVLNYKSIKEAKTELRNADFKIKKIIKVIKEKYIRAELLREVYNISTLLGTSLANLFNTLLPVNILENIVFEKRKEANINNSKTMYYSSIEEAVKEYEKYENKKIVKNISIISPTEKESKLLIREFKNYKKETNLCIHFSTPSLSFLSNIDIDTVFINNENSKYYYSAFKDMDTKYVIIHLCKILNIKIIFVGNSLSLKSFSDINFNKKNSNINFKDKKLNIFIEKMNKENNIEKDIYLSENNKKILEKIIKTETNKKIILYTHKKNNYSSIVCEDCGNIKKCNTCEKPLILYLHNNKNYLLCDMCKNREELSKLVKCDLCKSYRLKTLGIGTSSVTEHIKNIFKKEEKKLEIYQTDSNITTTDAKVRAEIKKYYENTGKNKILITTEISLNYLKDVDLIIVISIDSLFFIAEYTMDEQIFYLLNDLQNSLNRNKQACINNNFVIQTRQSEKSFEKYFSFENFYSKELEIRKKLELPPYFYVLTYESEIEIPIPRFLEKHRNYIIKLKVNTEKFKINIKLINRYIYFIKKDMWEDDKDLREKCLYNLYDFNFKVNPISVFG